MDEDQSGDLDSKEKGQQIEFVKQYLAEIERKNVYEKYLKEREMKREKNEMREQKYKQVKLDRIDFQPYKKERDGMNRIVTIKKESPEKQIKT